MIHQQILSAREKVIAVVGVVLLVLFIAVGYSLEGRAAFVAQDPGVNTKDQENSIKNSDDYIKNLKREVQDIQREVKTGVDISKANGLISTFESCIASARSKIGTNDFWNAQSECNSLSRDVEDYMRDTLRVQRECYNQKKSLDDRKREKKSNLDSQIKDITRNNKAADVKPLTDLVSKIDAQIATSDATYTRGCTTDTSDLMRDGQSELNSLFQDFYSLSNEVRQASDDVRKKTDAVKDFEKNIKPQCEKQKAREYKNFEKQALKRGAEGQEAIAVVKPLYEQSCVTLFKAMQTALQSGDTDAFEDARTEYWSLDREFWDTLNNTRGGLEENKHKEEQIKNINQDLKGKTRELSRMKANLKQAKKSYERTAKKYADSVERKEALAVFASYLKSAEDLIGRMEAGIAAAVQETAGDPDAYWYDRNEELNDLQQEFNEIQGQVQNIANVMQSLKEIERRMQEYRTGNERVRRAGASAQDIAPLENVVAEMAATLKQIWASAITDTDEAMSLLQSFYELQNDWSEQLGEIAGFENFQGATPTATFGEKQ